MTVSSEALLPRQCPAHSGKVVSRYDQHDCMEHSLTILSCTVLVRVVATEQNTGLVAVDESVVPPSWLGCASLAEVFGVVRRAVTKSLDVVASVASKNFSLDEGLSE